MCLFIARQNLFEPTNPAIVVLIKANDTVERKGTSALLLIQ